MFAMSWLQLNLWIRVEEAARHAVLTVEGKEWRNLFRLRLGSLTSRFVDVPLAEVNGMAMCYA